jgi:glycosyltransferase involved in cell wall biosynthesis
MHHTANGGAGAHVVASARALRRAGVDVMTIAANDSTDALADLTASFTPNEVPASTREQIASALRHFDPEIVHVHDVHDEHFLADLIRRHTVVISAHNHTTCTSGMRYFSPGEECRRSHGVGCIPNLLVRGCWHRRDIRTMPAAYRRTTERVRLVRSVQCAIAHSAFVLDDLVRAGARAALVPYFVEPVDDTMRRPPEDHRILFSGRVVPSKGLDHLLRAVRDTRWHVDVAGDGWALDRAKAKARELGVADRVTFHGWTSTDQLHELYQSASVVCVPSLWPEPFGIVGIEAMAHARPVVAYATGGIPEWLSHDVTGLLAPPGDVEALRSGLRQLLGDPARAAQMGEQGRAIAARSFSPEAYLHAVAIAYQRARDPRATPVTAPRTRKDRAHESESDRCGSS